MISGIRIDALLSLRVGDLSLKNNYIHVNKRIAGLKDEIEGLNSQKQAIDKELKVLYKQQKITSKLVSPLNNLLEIEKEIAGFQGKKSELKASIAKATQGVAETELE